MRTSLFIILFIFVLCFSKDSFSSGLDVSKFTARTDTMEHEGYSKPLVVKDVAFEGATNKLIASSCSILDKFAGSMKSNEKLDIKITVFTSQVTEKEKAINLSQEQSSAIKKYIIRKGIASNRIYAEGKGYRSSSGDSKTIIEIRKKLVISKGYTTPTAFKNVKFGATSDTIFSSSYPELKAFSNEVKKSTDVHILIIGHTSDIGTDEYNMNLSLNRARAVRNYMVTQLGMKPQNIKCIGMGDRYPLSSNRSQRDQQRNNRIEVAFKK